MQPMVFFPVHQRSFLSDGKFAARAQRQHSDAFFLSGFHSLASTSGSEGSDMPRVADVLWMAFANNAGDQEDSELHCISGWMSLRVD
jgi:hypothetical protein